ncbi:MAG: ABC transporter ATP-binding protein [Phycisphaerae bacterium]|nr:ABC transporter ATP-binding protein [Tepidisphaeraceae bacterium]
MPIAEEIDPQTATPESPAAAEPAPVAPPKPLVVGGWPFYRRAMSYFAADWPMVVLVVAVIALGALVQVLEPVPLAALVDNVLGGKEARGWGAFFLSLGPAGSAVGLIVTLAALTLGLRLLRESLAMARGVLNIRVGYGGLMRVRCDLFDKLQQLSLEYYRSQPQGDVIYRLSTDVYAFQAMFNALVNSILVSVVTVISMAVAMLAIDWRLGLIALAVIPLLAWAHRHFNRVLKDKWFEVKELDSALTTVIQRSLATMGLVQAFGQEAREYKRFEGTARSNIGKYVRAFFQEILYSLVVGGILGLGLALIIGYGGYLVYRDQSVHALGEQGFTIGKLLIFVSYMAAFYAPLAVLSAAGASLAQASVGAARTFEVLDRVPTVRDAPDALALPVRPRVIEFRALRFEYRPGTPVIRDLTATIRPGQMVAFVGPSGVGKSTILSLLPRFYDATEGAILIDGHDVRAVKIADLRKHVALVLQENAILPATVAENISYGRPDATPAQIELAARQAEADEFIRQLPQGYDTEINESGSNLSGGQRQRIAIARALATEAPVMILDEPTSALDPNNERQVTRTLNSLKGSRTIILVSHRLSTVVECDQIFVMSEGRIVERGTHAELLAMRGAYHEMARHQLQIEE